MNTHALHASSFRHLSIIGRYAYALACVTSLCKSWRLDTDAILSSLREHWSVIDMRSSTCRWFDNHPLGEFYAFCETYSLDPKSDRVQSFHHGFDEARMVICGSCYCAPRDGASMMSLLNVVGIMNRWQHGLPPLDRFAHAVWEPPFHENGFGMDVTSASFIEFQC